MITEEARDYAREECGSKKNALGPAFFAQHLSVVVAYAKRLAETVGADQEIVELAGWLHDIAAVQEVAALPRHPALSAEVARRLLLAKSYPAERTERVAACIASHATPVQVASGSAEEVCVSNADAMSQIVRPAYWLYFAFAVRRLGFTEGRDWLRQRVENNWAALIPRARTIIEKEYRQVAELLRL